MILEEWRPMKVAKIVPGLSLFFAAFFSCSTGKESRVPQRPMPWQKVIEKVGTLSSLRAVDLTGDGVKDIVLGAGKVEFQPTDSAVIALNGVNGDLLWLVPARDQIFGSPSFLDISGDGTPDVFIGGRSAEFMAINGRTGQIIWEYFPQGDSLDFTTFKLYNFYNPQFIEDVDDDGLKDILVANGGYVKALPGDHNRPPGKLMVISSANGELIAESYMPDGKETYMSCLVTSAYGGLKIIFGTGGERISGNLYITDLGDVLAGAISDAKILAEGNGKGFIAPPVLADINEDKIPDIIANAVAGKIIAIDGVSHDKIWELSLPGTEAYCSIAVGYFNDDLIPDFFTNFGIGSFPDLLRSYQLAVNGKDGQLLQLDSLGSFHYGSPVAYDVNGDGIDEGIFHVNHYLQGVVKNDLSLFDFANHSVEAFGHNWNGANIGSTPLLVDLDDDQLLDIVVSHENNPVDLFSLDYKTGITIHVLQTGIPISDPIKWGAYMGTGFDGIFKVK